MIDNLTMVARGVLLVFVVFMLSAGAILVACDLWKGRKK